MPPPGGAEAHLVGATGMKDVFQYTSLGIFCKGFGGHGIAADQAWPASAPDAEDSAGKFPFLYADKMEIAIIQS